MGDSSFFTAIQILWVVVTVAFAGFLVYRRVLSSGEDDQLFLEAAESKMEEEQKRILSRLDRVAPYTKGFGFASLVLTLIVLGFWAYQGYQMFTNPPRP